MRIVSENDSTKTVLSEGNTLRGVFVHDVANLPDGGTPGASVFEANNSKKRSIN